MAQKKKTTKKKTPAKKAAPRPAATAKKAPGEVGPGDRAPAFALPDQEEKTVRAKDLAGTPYVLFFYPRANTPGCTKETCGFRDHHAAFRRVGIRVFGVSPDAPSRQARFHSRYDVAFPLLCDTEKDLAIRYGCYKEKTMYGRKVMGIERSTFLVDGKGRIAEAWRKVKVPGHVEAVLDAAKTLGKNR
jgi:peroxiredoxin Q/BCP